MANETLGASFSIDVTNLKAGLAQANRLIKESQSEFQAAAAGMDDWSSSEDGLNAKIKSLNQITDVQRKKVDALQGEYDRLISEGLDPTSKEAVELRTKINNETAALNKNEAEIKKQKEALKNLEEQTDDTGDATDDMGDKFAGLKAAGGIAVGAIAAVGAACTAAIGAFFGLAESTRESRKLMAQLDTSFQSAGLSAENAEKTFTELYGVIGDEGAATEAAQQLAKISKDEKDLAANTRILTGVMAEYGSSIPTEGLAEGMAATAAMGSVQGVLADALEWQGVNLDDYNAKLATLATEEERAAYIQSTLTELYGASADAYRENNAEVIAAQMAQANLNNALNQLGAIAEPIMTTLKNLATQLLTTITPFVSLIGEGFAGALSGAAGASDQLAAGLSGVISTLAETIVSALPMAIETLISVASTVIPSVVSTISSQLPSIITTVVAFIPSLLSTLTGQLPVLLQAVISGISQIFTEIGSMLPEILPLIIDAVISVAETLIDNIDLLIDSGIALIMGLADGLIIALPKLIEKIPVIIEKLVSAISRNLPKILRAGVELLGKLGTGIIQAVPQLASKIPQIITTIVKGLKSGISSIKDIGSDIIRGLWNGINDMASWISKKIKGFGDSVLSGIKNFFGIKSPSRVMADEVGKNLALGIGQGFEKNISDVNEEITDAMNFDDPKAPTGGTPRRGGAGGVTVYQTNNFKQAYTSRYEQYKTKQELYAAARMVKAGAY